MSTAASTSTLTFCLFHHRLPHCPLLRVLCFAPLCCCLLAFGGTYSLLVASGGFQSFSLLLLSGGFKDKRFGSWASGFLTAISFSSVSYPSGMVKFGFVFLISSDKYGKLLFVTISL
nr:uncharacterized protein LOC113692633 [Coffea arabica]